jgi:hypothetical protein
MGSLLMFGLRLRQGSVSASTSTDEHGKIVHSRWIELTRKAARGPVVTKVPTVGQFLNRWLEDTVAPNLAPLTYAT